MANQQVGGDQGAEQKFSLVVKRAVLLPEVAAIREFARELKIEFDADPKLRSAFDADPQAFLAKRGIAADLQREILTEAGIAGAELMECFMFSCISTSGCLITHLSL